MCKRHRPGPLVPNASIRMGGGGHLPLVLANLWPANKQPPEGERYIGCVRLLYVLRLFMCVWMCVCVVSFLSLLEIYVFKVSVNVCSMECDHNVEILCVHVTSVFKMTCI